MATRSPTPGCFIGIAGLVVFGLITIWTVYTGYTQNKKIEQFTSYEQADLGVEYRDEDTIIGLRHRVREFGKDPAGTLELSVADLNDLIGHEDRLFDFRKMIAIQEIGETVTARIAFPMQTLFQGGKLRYLNGTAELDPRMEDGQLMLKIVDLKPDVGGEVPEGFLNFISGNVNLIAPFRDDKQMGPVLKRLQSVSTENGRVVVRLAR